MKIGGSSIANLGLMILLGAALKSQAQVQWNAFDDFYVNVPATGGAGNFTKTDWINNAGILPYDTGKTTPNAWSYAGGNFNGFGNPTSVGTYVSGAALYSLTAGGTYAGPGASYLLGGQDYWIGYNDNYAAANAGLPSAQTQIGKYTREWFTGSPNYAGNPDGVNDKYLWLQATGLSPSTDGLGAILIWTAPSAGTYSFSGSYVNGNYGNRSTSFAIVDSSNTVLFQKQTFDPAISAEAFGFDRTLAQGDSVQFQVGTPANGQGSPLGLAVTIIPEPSSSALLMAGFAVLGLVKASRRKTSLEKSQEG